LAITDIPVAIIEEFPPLVASITSCVFLSCAGPAAPPFPTVIVRVNPGDTESFFPYKTPPPPPPPDAEFGAPAPPPPPPPATTK